MQIGEFAARVGTTPRAIRHYEEQGLLKPERTSAGYRIYDSTDVLVVQAVRSLIEAGLSTTTIATYLDCLRLGQTRHDLVSCPALRAELAQVAQRLDHEQQRINRTRQALCAITLTD